MNEYEQIRQVSSTASPQVPGMPTIRVSDDLASGGLLATVDIVFDAGGDWIRLARDDETRFLARDDYLAILGDTSKGLGDSAQSFLPGTITVSGLARRFCPVAGCPEAVVWLPVDGTETCAVHPQQLLQELPP